MDGSVHYAHVRKEQERLKQISQFKKNPSMTSVNSSVYEDCEVKLKVSAGKYPN